LGAYLGDTRFTIFYTHRFEGRETEPEVQIEEISRLIIEWRVQLVGCDYGGGFWPNDELTRRFGWQRIVKYQYSHPAEGEVGGRSEAVPGTPHRGHVRHLQRHQATNVFRFPNWEQFQQPFAADFLNIFSEYSEQIRMNVYKKSPNCTDDTFHSILNCFLASMIRYPRPDVIAPNSTPKDPV
jgi:hypothetical protein